MLANPKIQFEKSKLINLSQKPKKGEYNKDPTLFKQKNKKNYTFV